MIEAELKARVREPDRVCAELRLLAPETVAVYRDVYYDRPDRGLTSADRELRVRVIETAEGRRCVLTYKDAAVDSASGSKPEHEIQADDATTLGVILAGLGFEPVIAFEKQCTNFSLFVYGRPMTATLVRVPELDGQTFLEVESLVDAIEHVQPVLADIRRLLAELGIAEADLTTELYTDAVASHRQTSARRTFAPDGPAWYASSLPTPPSSPNASS